MKYTPEIMDFLKQNVNGRSAKELTLMVNGHFGLSFTEKQIEIAKSTHGLRSGTKHTGRFTPEQIKFLENNVKGKPFAEVVVLFNKRFKTDFTLNQIKGFCNHKGLKNNLVRVKGGHYWTKEEISFLEKYAGEKTQRELTALINSAFNLSLTYHEVRSACFYYKIKTARIPAKCTREIVAFIRQNHGETTSCLTRMINDTFGTLFSKKQVSTYIRYYKYKTVYESIHELPVNTERIKMGSRIFIKVSMDGPYKLRWQDKRRWLWERANGKIPEGMVIILLDNNPFNCTLENLAMVSKAEHFMMMKCKLYTGNPEATLVGITVAKHLLAIHSRLKEKLGPEGHRRFVYKECVRRKAEKERKCADRGEKTIWNR
jgi:hypothetical protein